MDFFWSKYKLKQGWHVRYGWKDLPIRSKFWYSIQLIGPSIYFKKLEKIFLSRIELKILIFLKQRWRCMTQHCVINHAYIYQIGSLETQIIIYNWPMKLAVTCQALFHFMIWPKTISSYCWPFRDRPYHENKSNPDYTSMNHNKNNFESLEYFLNIKLHCNNMPPWKYYKIS